MSARRPPLHSPHARAQRPQHPPSRPASPGRATRVMSTYIHTWDGHPVTSASLIEQGVSLFMCAPTSPAATARGGPMGSGDSPLDMLPELREIKETGVLRAMWQLTPAATYSDLLDVFQRHSPAIWHYAGHGNALMITRDDQALRSLAFTSPSSSMAAAAAAGGDAHVISPSELLDLLETQAKKSPRPLQMVILNACHTFQLAQEVYKRGVPFVVGWQTLVENSACAAFSRGFYTALAAGQRAHDAFRAGVLRMRSVARVGDPEVHMLVTNQAEPIMYADGTPLRYDPHTQRLIPYSVLVHGIPACLPPLPGPPQGVDLELATAHAQSVAMRSMWLHATPAQLAQVELRARALNEGLKASRMAAMAGLVVRHPAPPPARTHTAAASVPVRVLDAAGSGRTSTAPSVDATVSVGSRSPAHCDTDSELSHSPLSTHIVAARMLASGEAMYETDDGDGGGEFMMTEAGMPAFAPVELSRLPDLGRGVEHLGCDLSLLKREYDRAASGASSSQMAGSLRHIAPHAPTGNGADSVRLQRSTVVAVSAESDSTAGINEDDTLGPLSTSMGTPPHAHTRPASTLSVHVHTDPAAAAATSGGGRKRRHMDSSSAAALKPEPPELPPPSLWALHAHVGLGHGIWGQEMELGSPQHAVMRRGLPDSGTGIDIGIARVDSGRVDMYPQYDVAVRPMLSHERDATAGSVISVNTASMRGDAAAEPPLFPFLYAAGGRGGGTAPQVERCGLNLLMKPRFHRMYFELLDDAIEARAQARAAARKRGFIGWMQSRLSALVPHRSGAGGIAVAEPPAAVAARTTSELHDEMYPLCSWMPCNNHECLRLEFAHAAASQGMYLCAGSVKGRAVRTTELHDVLTGTVRTLLPLPVEAVQAAGAYVESSRTFVVSGGIPGPSPSLEAAETQPLRVYALDTGAEGDARWVAWPDMTTPRTRHVSVVMQDHGLVCMLGGHNINNGATLRECVAYDPRTRAWMNMNSMTVPRSDFGAALDSRSRLYAMGGDTGYGSATRACEMLDMRTASFRSGALPASTELTSWMRIPEMGTRRRAHTVCSSVPINDARVSSLHAAEMRGSFLPVDSTIAGATDTEYIFAVGGTNAWWRNKTSGEKFDVLSQSWSRLPSMSVDRAQACVAVYMAPCPPQDMASVRTQLMGNIKK